MDVGAAEEVDVEVEAFLSGRLLKQYYTRMSVFSFTCGEVGREQSQLT